MAGYNWIMFWILFISAVFWDTILVLRNFLLEFVSDPWHWVSSRTTVIWDYSSVLWRSIQSLWSILKLGLGTTTGKSYQKCRKPKTNVIWRFPRRWMILSCYMLLPFGARQLPLATKIDSFYYTFYQYGMMAYTPLAGTHN